MTIISLNFAVFALGVLLVYYVLPHRLQNVLLLLASYAFYASWAWEYLAVLVALTAFNYVIAQRLRDGQGRHVRLLRAGIGVNFLALGIFKYADFFTPQFERLLSTLGVSAAGGLHLLLPVGMSFYVVQAVAYLIDVSRGQTKPEPDPVTFALYMAYFPRLLSGPIERARVFLPQLRQPRIVDNAALSQGATLIVIGIVRKIVIADTLRQLTPDDIFVVPGQFASIELVLYLVVYAFVLYNDFAGYTNVARGVSALFGIRLSANFDIPYFSRNLTEFWNRWHITFSHWLRDYIYYPTSRALLRRNPSRTNRANILIPPLLTMLLSGVWHGTGWGMIAWGALHGAYLVGERLLALWRPARPAQQQPLWRQTAAALLTFTLVVIAWVPFRMDLPTAVDYWRGMVAFSWGAALPGWELLLVLALALLLDGVQRWKDDATVFVYWPRPVQVALLVATGIAVFVAIQGAAARAPFVYQGF